MQFIQNSSKEVQWTYHWYNELIHYDYNKAVFLFIFRWFSATPFLSLTYIPIPYLSFCTQMIGWSVSTSNNYN